LFCLTWCSLMHPLSYKWHNLILLYDWIILDCIYYTLSLCIHQVIDTQTERMAWPLSTVLL
jgi:hypothetical protein